MTGQTGPPVPVGGEEAPRGPRIVVGVDFSSGARAALLFALQDAARRGTPVEAVTAYRPPDYWMDFYPVGSYQPDQMRTAALDRLRAFVAEVVAEGPQPPPEVHAHAALGAAADVLVHEAHGADLLVVGSRGHGGFTSMLLGSVSMHCALHASCPVTVVHAPEDHRELRVPAGFPHRTSGDCQTHFGHTYAATVLAFRGSDGLVVSPQGETPVPEGTTLHHVAGRRIEAGRLTAGR